MNKGILLSGGTGFVGTELADRLVRGKGLGGTTTLATGNAVRYDRDLKALGIDLAPEYDRLEAENAGR